MKYTDFTPWSPTRDPLKLRHEIDVRLQESLEGYDVLITGLMPTHMTNSFYETVIIIEDMIKGGHWNGY